MSPIVPVFLLTRRICRKHIGYLQRRTPRFTQLLPAFYNTQGSAKTYFFGWNQFLGGSQQEGQLRPIFAQIYTIGLCVHTVSGGVLHFWNLTNV